MSKPIVPVFFATDDGYVKFLHVAIHSLVVNTTKNYQYNIHILCNGMTEANKKSFEVFNRENIHVIVEDLSEEVQKRIHLMPGKHFGGEMTYFRAFIPRLFPQYDKAVYLDVDITINADIAEFYNVAMGDNYICGTMEFVTKNVPPFVDYVEKFVGVSADCYINAGIIVMNCKQLREIKFEETFFDMFSKVELHVDPDQCVLNFICRNDSVVLPNSDWNEQPLAGRNRDLKDVKLVHYHFTSKPWMFDNIMYEELFWEHAKNTMFYQDILDFKKTVTEEVKDAAERKGEFLALEAISLMAGPCLEERLAQAEATEEVVSG